MRGGFLFCVLALTLLAATQSWASPQETPAPLEITRAVRPWEFLCSVGTRAGIFGNESGRVEAWTYPLKLFREFHLLIHTESRALPAESLVRAITVRPESTTITYAGDTFSIRETFFVPVDEPGVIITFEIETEKPLELEASFVRDFQLEWPAALGATYESWDPALHAFYLGEEQKKYSALIGSPTADDAHEEFQTNYSESQESSFRLGAVSKGRETRVIVAAGSVLGRAEAEKTYRHLTNDYASLLKIAAGYYRNYLAKTVSVELPDKQLQQAYDWSRISMVQGLVTNPYLGTGLVAGYRTSGTSQRPGFAWFFGRDSFWTSFGLNSTGDFKTSRLALEFISKYQREDGKIPHEIAQGANFVDWFQDYPYPYASADATPLYIIAVNDYVTESGDVAFAKEKWDRLQKAYAFLKSTYDERGLPRNFGVGHGWVEGGPLLPVETEFYQVGLGAEALRAFSNLALLTAQEDLSKTLLQEFKKQRELLHGDFWIEDKKRFAIALDTKGQRVDEPSVLATVPMWFELLEVAKAPSMIHQLADSDHQTDWGMRIISNRSPLFSGGGYHYGSVWPLFTGWASVAEYRYHETFPAYANLRANALLALDGSPGHVTEVLSGDYYQALSTSSPHQIWSASMVVSPLLRGLFGLAPDATKKTLHFTPHLPADWTSYKISNLRVGDAVLTLSYHKTLTDMTLEVTRTGGGCELDYNPALANSALDVRLDINGRETAYDSMNAPEHSHLKIKFALKEGKNIIRLRTSREFGLTYNPVLPDLGGGSGGLRILSSTLEAGSILQEWTVSGRAGATYEMNVWNPALIESVQGAELIKDTAGNTKLRMHIPEKDGEEYVPQFFKIYLHPAKGASKGLHE